MNAYRVLTSSHQDEQGKDFPKGSVVRSARNLTEIFGTSKFEDLGPASKVINVAPALPQAEPVAPTPESVPPLGVEGTQGQPGPDDNPAAEEPTSPEPTVRSDKGEDVTAAFPVAVENEFKVFKGKGGWHYVTEPESPNKALNESALKAGAVEAFIKGLVK